MNPFKCARAAGLDSPDLAKAIRAEELLLAQEEEIEREQAEAAGLGRQLKSPGAADVDGLLRTHRYELVLAARHKQILSQIAQVQAECERRRQAVVEADRQVRVLEKLRERQAAAHRLQGQQKGAVSCNGED